MFAAETTLEFQLRPAAAGSLTLSVVIPTFNERGNVARLFRQLNDALAGLDWEAIFVDDGSTDGTVEAITRLSRQDRRVRLITRFGRRGLSSAVIEGMLSSTAPIVAVMDADLQHDELLLPRLVEAVETGTCDLAIGSRYVQGGSVGEWSRSRARISQMANRLAEVVTRAPLTDPMSGFFAIRRDQVVLAAPQLSGTGFKILLDLIASSPRPLRIQELPYRFRPREEGKSKLDSMVIVEYLQLLVEKRLGKWLPLRLLKFCLVGATGLGVHMVALGAGLRAVQLPFSEAMLVATLLAMTFNFVLNNAFTYRDRRLHGRHFLIGAVKFYLVCSVGALANFGVGNLVFRTESWWVAGAAGAAVGALWNFAICNLFTWNKAR